MEILKTTKLSKAQRVALLALWNNEYPVKLSYAKLADFENYLDNLTHPSHILILNKQQQIIGWYFDFIRNKKKWFAILIDSKSHKEGYGTILLNIAKEIEIELNGWVIDHNQDKKQDGGLYKSPLNFYLKNDFSLLAKNRLELASISAVQIQWKNKLETY